MCLWPHGAWQAVDGAKVLASYAEKAVLSPAISGGGRHAVFSVLNVSSGGAAMTPDTILLISSPTEEPAVIDVKAAFTALFGEPTSLYDPSFSACGRFLVFCAETPTESGWNYSLYRMDLTNGNIAEIYAMGMVRPNSPSASAGGGRIAFASWSQEDFGSRLAMGDMDAGRIFPLSDVLVSGFISPVVSADGRVVAYNDDATRTIAVIQVGEGKSEVVASLASPGDRGQRVGISADGRLMAYYETDEYGHKRAYLYDRTPPGSRRLISRKDTGEPATGSGNVYDLKSIGLSGDGSFCAFSLASPDIVPDADENYLGIYVSDGVGMAARRPPRACPRMPSSPAAMRKKAPYASAFRSIRSTCPPFPWC
jgi:Tol biopolymer transport system component